MSQFSVVILPDAEAEIGGAFRWYVERDVSTAHAFRAETLDCIDGLAHSAARWKRTEDGTRQVLLRQFPYTVIYKIEGDMVFVIAVAHQRREPGYWRNR